MHDGWLSNTYVVADEAGGTAMFVDSGGPIDDLLEFVERERLTVTHVLRTHGHEDHVGASSRAGSGSNRSPRRVTPTTELPSS